MKSKSAQSKEKMENAVEAWIHDRYGPNHLVTEYVVVAKVQDMSPGNRPARYQFAWRVGADMDAVYGLMRRLKKYLDRKT